MTQKIFGSSSIGFIPPNWLVCDSYQGAVGKPYVQDSRRQQQSPLSSGASQAEFLREGIFRCRAGVGGQGSRAAMESP